MSNDHKKLTVAFFGAKTYPPEIGGIETHIYNLSQEFQKINIKLIVFTGKNNAKKYERVNENLEIYRVPHLKNRYLLKLSMVFATLRYLKILKNEIDVYHAHDPMFGFFLQILGFKPIVYTAHGCGFLRDDWPFPIKQFLKFMEISIFKRADAVICVDYKTNEVVKKYRKGVTFVIPNGVRPEIFKNLDRSSEYPSDKIIIFSSGRLIPSKGFQDLIDAYLLLPKDVKDKAELFIAGKGPMLEKLRNKVSVDKRIHILGYVP
ncbi:TPA: glycosyltransferase family 4 protein, partial [Candidatus Aciduliprofundum boonei]|nr:glycosyltransferase family 4 protein [Candidatus Aciduliprofundum boonei]